MKKRGNGAKISRLGRSIHMTDIKENILKVRDDHIPIRFVSKVNENNEQMFKLININSTCWLSEDTFNILDLRKRIEPWLTSLFQSEHLSLLVGSGLTTAVKYEATLKNAENGMSKPEIDSEYTNKIEEAVIKSVKRNGRGEPNIEDYIRIINDLLRGLEILGHANDYTSLSKELNRILENFVSNISEIEHQIATAEDTTRTEAFNKLVMFLMSFASRTGTRDRLNIFSTNYDRLIEAGAELAGIHLLERFIGTLSPIFRSSRLDFDMHYNPPGIRGEPRYLEGVARLQNFMVP